MLINSSYRHENPARPAARWAVVGKLLLLGAAILTSYFSGLMSGRSENAQQVLQTSDSYEIRQAVARYAVRKTLDVGEPTVLSPRSVVVSVRRKGDTSDSGCDVLVSKLPVPGSETLGAWIVSADKCGNWKGANDGQG
ncbi:hypothetical protein AXYL_06748 (plasmid) [Achromobacter xylosoxidans A8]|uniref:Uncharacterized protein n=1 Tax=Achromobacter xylosoxidans (strain A8) TaxID=762376 RepID=E3HY78_ACHXA|nr:hypothetical protein AXYL_06748 [Achromobacter xylosoxidans A8]